MKVSRELIESIAFLAVYFSALWLYTLPIQHNPLPFGDVDASSHFVIGDYISSHDTSIFKQPDYILNRYGGQNAMFPGYIWYPPQYWTNTAIAQVLGGERSLPFFIAIAVFCTAILASSYVLIRSLFGFWPAILSSLLLAFSTRDYMVYLWGQWPQSLSFAFTPLALYSYYRYQESRSADKEQPLYLYFLSLTLLAQFLFHPQGMIASILALIIFTIVLSIKRKKIPVNIKHALFAASVFIALSLIAAPLNIGEFFSQLTSKEEGTKTGLQLDKLFKWYQGIKNDPGLPDFYFTYNKSHGTLKDTALSWWTLPLLLIGIAALALRRTDKDYLMLSFLVSFYILTRLAVIGMGQKDIRMFAYEAHVFYPIIAIGALSIPSLIKRAQIKTLARFGIIILFIVCTIFINGNSAYSTLKSQEQSITRINSNEYEAADWMRQNLPEQANVYIMGTYGFQFFGGKIKWLNVLSQRTFVLEPELINTADHVVVDYTDALALGNQQYLTAVQQFDQSLSNSSLLYNKGNIKVYKVV